MILRNFFFEVYHACTFVADLAYRAKQGRKRDLVHFISIEGIMICATSEDSFQFIVTFWTEIYKIFFLGVAYILFQYEMLP